MKISNEKVWKDWRDNNTDPYSADVVSYAERWANLMEEKMAAGAILADCAEETSHVADIFRITGFMYGVAVNVLVTCWEHGDELHRWVKVQKGK